MVRSTTGPGRWRRRLTWLVVLLGALIVVAVPLGSRLPLGAAAPLEWVAYSWLGLAFYLFLVLLVLEPVRLVARLVLRRRTPAGSAPEAAPPSGPQPAAAVPRRVFLARGLAGPPRGGPGGAGRPRAADARPPPRGPPGAD